MDSLVVSLADAAPLGGKAGALARLMAAGLPVPDGVALTHAAFAPIAGDPERAAIAPPLEAELAQIARRLAPLAVRSSMSIEDRADSAGAGVFASVVEVEAEDVWPAIRAVWASALSPLARIYAQQRGAGALAVSVIVQRFVAGPRVTVYTRPPGRPDGDEAWIEPAGAAARRVRRDAAGDDLLALALAAERAIDASGGADVELVIGADRTWVVQARPIVHPPATPGRRAPPPMLLRFSCATPALTWRWDVAHNPDPLSPAQAGLVEAVLHADASPWRMQVAAGYLYVAEDTAPVPPPPPDAASVRARFDALAAAMNAAASPASEGVRAAIDAYVAAYRIFAFEIAPLVTGARRVLPALLATRLDRVAADATAAQLVPRRAAGLDAAVVATARGAITDDAMLALAADHAPAWDVAVASYGERPALVRAAVERVRAVAAAVAPAIAIAPSVIATSLGLPLDELERAVAIAEVAAAIAEEDDACFARAQAMVRRALLAAGRRLGLDDPDDACWLSLDELAAAEAGELFDPVTARGRAAAARGAGARARGWAMPLRIRDGAPLLDAPATGDGSEWRGAGSGARVIGTVHRIADLGRAVLVPRGAIAVVPTVTPALALVLAGARAIVSDHGGVLDHGAAIARELGITCVVGCAGAWDALRDGDLVEVDGDAGRVARA